MTELSPPSTLISLLIQQKARKNVTTNIEENKHSKAIWSPGVLSPIAADTTRSRVIDCERTALREESGIRWSSHSNRQ